MAENPLLVFTTAPDADTARRLAQLLLGRRLAACVSTNSVTSTYRWQGAIEQAEEVALTIKTTSARYPEIEAAILDVHPYDVPEILALPVSHGSAPYLAWLASETGPDAEGR